LAVIVCLFAFLGCGDSKTSSNSQSWLDPAELSAEVANDWYTLALKTAKETAGYTPPVVARTFGYMGIALYESVRPGMPAYRSLQGQINGLALGSLPSVDASLNYHWEIVANETLSRIFPYLYPTASTENLRAAEDLRQEYLDTFSLEIALNILDRSLAFGAAMADAVYSFSVSDGQEFAYLNNFPPDYVPPEGEDLWVPTLPSFQSAMLPYWGDVRPFVTANVTETQPPAPYPYSTEEGSDFYNEAFEVYLVTENITQEQLTIAQFWSDDPGLSETPPGHSLSILKQVLEQEDESLAKAAEAYVKMGIGVHDAFVCCWRTKFTYNLIRPITYIRQEIDSNFTPIVNTPPFPEYTSAHSVQSEAAAEILTGLFGDGYAFDDWTHADRTDIDGTPRHFDSFYAFAEEASISRLYGGIHFRQGIEIGVDQGTQIGLNIQELIFRE